MPDRFAAPSWLDVSRETLQKLEELAILVQKWSRKINLVSQIDVNQIWDRHILDSAQVLDAAPKAWRRWVDLGSGGGFPGLVVSVLAEGGQKVVLVESDGRKAAFLQSASISLDLDTEVINARVENISPQKADVVSARALAPLDDLLTYAAPHVLSGGICLFLKGAKSDDELTRARRNWNMSVDKIPSKTESSGTILKIGALSRV